MHEIGQIGYLTARFAKGLIINPAIGLVKMATYLGVKWAENFYREIQEHPFMLGAPDALFMKAGIEIAKQAAHDIVAGLRQQFEIIIGEQIERSPVVAQTAAEVRAQLEQLYEHHCRHGEATFYNKLRLVSEELPLRLKLLATALNAHYEQLPAGDKAEVLGDMTAILFPGIPTRFYGCAFKYAGTAINRLFRGTPAHVLQEAREIPNPRVVLETEFVDGEWRVIKPRKFPVVHEPKLPARIEGSEVFPRVVDKGKQGVRVQPALPANEPAHKTPAFKPAPAEAIKDKASLGDRGKQVVRSAEAKGIGEAALIEHGIQDIARAIDTAVGTGMTANELLQAKDLQKPIISQEVPVGPIEQEIADYWKSLMRDPAHGNTIKPHGIEEASAVLRAEKCGLLKGPFRRDNRGGDFIDALGQQWDVKRGVSRAPNGRHVFNADELAKALRVDIMCGENILLDLRRLEIIDYESLRSSILKHLTLSEIEKIRIIH